MKFEFLTTHLYDCLSTMLLVKETAARESIKLQPVIENNLKFSLLHYISPWLMLLVVGLMFQFISKHYNKTFVTMNVTEAHVDCVFFLFVFWIFFLGWTIPRGSNNWWGWFPCNNQRYFHLKMFPSKNRFRSVDE